MISAFVSTRAGKYNRYDWQTALWSVLNGEETEKTDSVINLTLWQWQYFKYKLILNFDSFKNVGTKIYIYFYI